MKIVKIVLLSAIILSFHVSPSFSGETPWQQDAGILAVHPKVVDSLGTMQEFERGQGTGQFIVLLKKPPKLQTLSFSLRADQAKQVRQQEVASLREQALQAMPDFPRASIVHSYDNLFGFSADLDPDQLRLVLENPYVEYVEPVRILYPQLKQGIPLQLSDTYRSSYNGEGLSVAIVDTGIDYNNPYLDGGTGGFPNSKVIGGYDFGENKSDPMDLNGHGTSCAGIVAGELCNDCGDYIGGVAYNAKLYALKISDTSTGGSATTASMIAAWDWAVTHQNDDPDNPIMITSTSFGGGELDYECDKSSPGMTAAAENAVAAGITVFSSSGNSGLCDSMGWPACISSVISVGAVYDNDIGSPGWCVSEYSCAPKSKHEDCDSGWAAFESSTSADQVTVYSNSASFLDLFAPSHNAYTLQAAYQESTFNQNFGGTSAACPYAAGAAAALQSAAKDRMGTWLPVAEIRQRLSSTGDTVTDTKVPITKPRVNLEGAINTLEDISLCEALDNCDLNWSTGGDSSWYGQSNEYHYGGSSARSGAIADNQDSWLETTVTGPGTLRFHWQVSSEGNYDWLSFYMGGALQEQISGTVAWQENVFDIPSGSNTLMWRYSKDGSVSSRDDTGWVDKVVWIPKPGSLQVFIQPAEAVQAGAQWRRRGTITWFDSEAIEKNVPVGEHIVEFRPVPGWRPDGTIKVTVQSDQATQITASYSEGDAVQPGVLMLLLDDEE